MTDTGPAAAAPDPAQLLRSRSYVVLLVLGAVIGVPVAGIAYFFLKVVGELQQYFYTTLPGDLGFDHQPLWWPLPLLAIGGLLVGLDDPPPSGHRRPQAGRGAEDAGAILPTELPGITLAALATLSLGAVLGPEAPLIAMGSGLGALAMSLFGATRRRRRCS